MRTKQTSQRIRTLRRRRLALALVSAMAAPMALAQNIPNAGTVTSGTATIGQNGNEMTVTQTTKGAIIDWGSFNIGAGYGVTFDQQFGNASVTLNRVIGFGYAASNINGTLTANGNVFIINPNGIVFGSGAQVNVGGLVASTLAISNADFLSGVSSGQYRFTSNGSTAGAVTNNGQLTAATGGTIGLIGSKINNAGTISTTNGSVVFGATNQVTLDFFGDGLTQVTVSGNGLGVSNCSLNCNGGITSSGNVYALGGHIEMRSNTMDGQSAGSGLFVDPANGGRVWIGGTVSATTSGTRHGSVIIDAGMGNIDLGGVDGRTGNVSANASNAGEDGGTVELRGNQLFTHLCYGNGPSDLCVANNRLGLVMASAFGTGGSAGEIHIDVNRFYHGGVLVAVANDGSGGLIDINAGSAEIYNRIFAYGNNGAGGTININADNVLLFRGQQPWLGGPGTAYWSASLLAYGTTTGGAVNIEAGSLVVTDLGNVTPQNDDVAPVINVTGQLGGNGGTINIHADYASIGDTWFANASGDGLGGSIGITADTLLLDGGLVATGGTTDGTVTTTATGSLFAGTNAYVTAGTWLVHAPSIQILPAGAQSGSGAVLTDEALSSTLDGGTSVQLYADAALASGATGSIYIGDGVDILHSSGDAVALDLRATGGIYGGDFSIVSTGGPLDLSFAANVLGSNPDDGFVSFSNTTLASNGGDITMDADGRGVYLEYSQLSSTSGNISIVGSGDDHGVELLQSGLSSTSGNITVTGSALLGEGVSFNGSGSGNGITTTSGSISVSSTGLFGLNVADVPFSTDTGNITLQGTATGSDFGVYVGDGGLSTNGGDITLIGSSVDRTGVLVYNGDLASHGGDISIVGTSTNLVGVQVSGNDIDSGGGNISIDGQGASTGLIVAAARIYSGAGDISLAGIGGGNGAGVGIGQGSVIATTSGDVLINGVSDSYDGILLNTGDVHTAAGDITMIGEGGNVGVNLLHGNIGTATGGIDITGTGGAIGIHLGDTDVVTTSGGIGLAGLGGNGAGFMIDNDSSIDGGTGVVALGAGNDGSSDAIILQGRIASAKAVNLRPLNVNNQILLGAGNGFSLINSDLAMIDAPLLVIGSAQHAGAINVAQAVDWDGNLTLQNQGGTGGINLQAAVDVGDKILTLASGGNIGQTATGGITAHSLLAIASGNVALSAAQNNVAASSLAGTAGGDFSYTDVDDVAIGSVSSFGFSSAAPTGLVSLSAEGIAAGGGVLVRAASGDLTLGANVSGRSIDLVAADVFHNPGGATLTASNGWRIFARTWDGEERGGLQGDGPFDIFGCTFGQDCTGVGQGNQFIYQERRLVQAPIAPETVSEWLDEDDVPGGAMDLMVAALCPVADSAQDLVQAGSSKDELAREWLKSRHRLRLSNCIDSKNTPGCKF